MSGARRPRADVRSQAALPEGAMTTRMPRRDTQQRLMVPRGASLGEETSRVDQDQRDMECIRQVRFPLAGPGHLATSLLAQGSKAQDPAGEAQARAQALALAPALAMVSDLHRALFLLDMASNADQRNAAATPGAR
mmetsp:Transcript_62796/g.136379  ORF Transcript_62796/g.136379 Transcript_62796/m.136379 type:complete len:136 (-) Transcript_62796:469-876(-)